MAQVIVDSFEEDCRLIQEHYSKEEFERLSKTNIIINAKLKRNYEHLKSIGVQCIYKYINIYQ